MPSHLRILPRPVREWFAASGPMTRREFYVLWALVLLLVTVALAGLVVYADENRERAREGQEAHAVACARKAGLRERVAETQAFLDHGGRIPGVSKILLRRALARDKIELRAFAPVHCKGDPDER